jgi:hypothetical protein
LCLLGFSLVVVLILIVAGVILGYASLNPDFRD